MQSRNNSTSFGRVKNQLFSSTPLSLYHTPLFLKHINTLYLITLCHVITISTSKCNQISRYFKHSLLSMKRFIEASTFFLLKRLNIYNYNIMGQTNIILQILVQTQKL